MLGLVELNVTAVAALGARDVDPENARCARGKARNGALRFA